MVNGMVTCNGSGDSSLECRDRGLGHLLGCVLGLARLAASHHVGFQQSSFQEDVVVVEGLVHSGQHSFSHFLGAFQFVVAIGQNLESNQQYLVDN